MRTDDGWIRLLRRLDRVAGDFRTCRRHKRICVRCRRVGQLGATCPECGQPTQQLDYRARAPRKRASTRTWRAFTAQFVRN